MTKLHSRLLAFLCSLALLVCLSGSLPTSAPLVVEAAASLDDLEAQLKDLQAQEKEIKNELSAASSDLSASKKRKELLESQIANAQAQIALFQQRIEATEAEIAATEAKLVEKETEIAAAEEAILAMEGDIEYTHEQLGARLRAIAKTGNLSAVQRLLNTDNYEEYLLKSKAAECIAKRDQEMMDKLEAALEEIHAAKADLENQKQEISAQKAALEVKKQDLLADKAVSDAKKKELDTLFAAVQSEIKKLQSSVSGYNDELKEVQRKIEEADAAIEKLIKETETTYVYDDDLMWWPVPAVCNISSYFGPRWGTQHRGIDISNGPVPIYGQNIYAAADGVVIAVNYTSSYGTGWSYGYGYCVLVDHGLDSKGRKVTTMYAHCSKMFARVGDVVEGGKTVLAQAGSTGNVTGPHLHFEVRLDGERVNPYPNYVRPDRNIPQTK